MGGASKFLMLLSTPFPRLYPCPSALRFARHSRAPLAALSTAAQNRFSSSGSRPRQGFSVRAAEQIHTQTGIRDEYGESFGSPPNCRSSSHPWPEWLRLVEHVTAGGYVDQQISAAFGEDDDSFSGLEELLEEFVKVSGSCLLFARSRPDLLGLLPKKDIEVVVLNGSPFLFKNALNSIRRMKSFLGSGENDVLESEKAHTVDLMRYLLSYAYNPFALKGENDSRSSELMETSVRSLLNELVKISGNSQEPNVADSMPRHTPFRYEQSSRPPGQNIEMKRGDWICPKCSFMNFARNMKCLECDEGRPKRQLTGAEWECPQCDFFNYGRNMSCLRCDCKRPGEIPSGTPAAGFNYGNGKKPSIEQILSAGISDKSELERRLTENDAKAERWFSKVSQLDDSSDLSSAIADEDFPEIMPLRKGVNRFVVSTRKTPLERRLANAQYKRDSGNDGSLDGNDSLSGIMGAEGSDKTTESVISRSLDRILGRSSATSGTGGSDNQLAAGEMSTRIGSRFSSPERRDSGYVPFVPLSADMFKKKPSAEEQQSSEKEDSVSGKVSQPTNYVSAVYEIEKSGNALLSEDLKNQTESKRDKESISNQQVQDLATVSDEDFPEIMPMRKGENRFVISKKKDRSLTSPQYKRRLAMEQANNSNFVPFVPFPPDYFAKKDKQPEVAPSTEKAAAETSVSMILENAQNLSEMLEGNKFGGSDLGFAGNVGQTENPQPNRENWNSEFSGRNFSEKMDAGYRSGPRSVQQPSSLFDNNKGSMNSGFPRGVTAGGGTSENSTQQFENSQNPKESSNRAFSGKSLEGSAVTELDPLDMSEEAKAQRWFRRVAQIKDISELSNIPDEDFPSIMPMRKGVNRFVVSKRKTPLERRLTSPQYRRNLPIVSSEPEKDAS